MKKVFLILILFGIGYVGYNYFTKEEISTNKFIYAGILDNIDSELKVNLFTIYGKHLNLEGEMPNNEGEYQVVLKNNDKEILVTTLASANKSFKTSLYLNDGINLEKLSVGEYLFLLKDKINGKYYTLINNSNYHDNEYYTITKDSKNNLITFQELSYNNKKYWTISVKETKLPDNIYDVVIDPGHGGIDTGAGNGRYNESKFTLDYAKTLKDVLEEEGLKVKLTRESDIKIDHYGEGSRTGIPYEVKAKLMLSIHLNSSNSSKQKGVEIYKAYGDNNDYAKVIADNIVNEVGTKYSNNPQNKVIDGVYMRVYSESDRESVKKDAKKGNFEPYNIDDSTTYYYFIRETGGIMTKAFSDGRNPKYKANPYRNSNQGVEAYLCELAYISQTDDLKLVLNKKDAFIKALKNSVLYYIDINE